jgi:Generalcontrol nonderepressible 1 (Gcn1) N-terminal
LFAKETNDAAISAFIDTLMAHQGVLLGNYSTMDGKISKLISSGLKDKRSKIKSGWALAISEIMWNVSQVNPALIAFSKEIAKDLFTMLNEVASNAVQASQNGTIIAGYAISAATLGRWLEWQDAQLGNS